MTDKQIIIDGVNVSECECMMEDYQQANNLKGGYEHIKNVCELGERGSEYYNLFCKYNPNCNYKQLKRKEQECEELHSRTASIIYSLTGGRLSYSTYTLEGCEQAYHDQLEIDVERATKELEEKLQAKEQECEKLKHKVELMMDCTSCKIDEYKQTLTEIKEIAEKQVKRAPDGETFARPEIKQILQKISEVEDEHNG